MEAGSGITRALKVMLSNTSVFALPVKTTDLNAIAVTRPVAAKPGIVGRRTVPTRLPFPHLSSSMGEGTGRT